MALRYYLLLLFHVGTNEGEMRSLKVTKRDFRALLSLEKRSGGQVIFSFILPVVGNDIARNR